MWKTIKNYAVFLTIFLIFWGSVLNLLNLFFDLDAKVSWLSGIAVGLLFLFSYIGSTTIANKITN